MSILFTLTFQGEVEAAGPLAAADEREVSRAAFPRTPPRDAATREGFQAFEIAPLESGRLLLSAVANRGDRDKYDRPVLRATGCVLERAQLSGALRDVTAVWRALAAADSAGGFEAFVARAAELSVHSSPEAFAAFQAELERAGAFYARVAAALGEESADLYVGALDDAPELLRPVLGLLPLSRLMRIHLSIGSEPSDYREPVLVLAGSAPERESKGVLAGLFGGGKDDDGPAVAVDFGRREVHGSRREGPTALAEAVADPRPWPGGLDGAERYRMLLDCVDAPKARSPFDAVPELGELREIIRRIEAVSSELAKWR